MAPLFTEPELVIATHNPGKLREIAKLLKDQGKVKKSAGKRSGLGRSAKRALVVKKTWLDLILAGRKTWGYA